jgi:hypothetical protein
MSFLVLRKRSGKNINVLVDDDIFEKLKEFNWIDHPCGPISSKNVRLVRYVFFLKNGFWPVKVYNINRNKYDCRESNITKKCPFSQVSPNKKSLKCDFIKDRMIGVYYCKKKQYFYAARGYGDEKVTICFSSRQLGYFKAKDLAEMARRKLVSLSKEELLKCIKFQKNKPKTIACGKIKVFNFSDLGYNSDGEYQSEQIDNFIHTNQNGI